MRKVGYINSHKIHSLAPTIANRACVNEESSGQAVTLPNVIDFLANGSRPSIAVFIVDKHQGCMT